MSWVKINKIKILIIAGNPELRLLSVWSFACFWALQFLPTPQKHAGRCTGYAKLPVTVIV